MNCYNCGKEVNGTSHGFVCQKCMKEATEGEWFGDEPAKECGDMPLSPKEAVRAMLDGEVLTGHENSAWKKGLEAIWDGADFVVRCNADREWSSMSSFDELIRKKSKTRPMGIFECLAWVNSPDSHGWLVSIKPCDEDWGDWDLPQRFKYDGNENHPDAYRRARMLSDKSGIDESTIQGFLVEVANE